MKDDILVKCVERREAKKKKIQNPTEENRETYRRLCRKIKNECKEAKREWRESKCVACENSFRIGQSKDMYTAIRYITKEGTDTSSVVKNHQGEKVSLAEEVIAGRKEHYMRFLFDDEHQRRRADDKETEVIDIPEIMQEEIEKSIGRLAKGKAPGVDGWRARCWWREVKP